MFTLIVNGGAENVRRNKYDFNSFNPRRRLLYIGTGIILLILAFIFDNIIFNETTLIVAYIPLMILTGFLVRYNISLIFISLISTYSLYYNSVESWTFELALFRWMSFFLVAFIIKVLKTNIEREKENLIYLTTTLSESIDARDKYTAFHSKNVAYYSVEIAKAMNLSKKECDHIYVGGLLHDIGKIGIPEGILNKPSRLTKEEYEIIKRHPEIGFNMLKHIPYLKKNGILDIVLFHHEKFDGTGYPKGLKSEGIPLVARIMAVADAFDAMTSKRAYRTDIDLEYSLIEVNKGIGTKFDPEIVGVFLDLIHNGKIEIKGLQRNEVS